MPSIVSLISNLRLDFPQFHFTPSDDFRWSSEDMTVCYPAETKDFASLLHELAHGILKHSDYSRDIQLLEMERDAWNLAKTQLGPQYTINIKDSVIERALDSYRDWLHARSTCPNCTATGFQTKKQHYGCLACGEKWRVNEARLCGLKRYSLGT